MTIFSQLLPITKATTLAEGATDSLKLLFTGKIIPSFFIPRQRWHFDLDKSTIVNEVEEWSGLKWLMNVVVRPWKVDRKALSGREEGRSGSLTVLCTDLAAASFVPGPPVRDVLSL